MGSLSFFLSLWEPSGMGQSWQHCHCGRQLQDCQVGLFLLVPPQVLIFCGKMLCIAYKFTCIKHKAYFLLKWKDEPLKNQRLLWKHSNAATQQNNMKLVIFCFVSSDWIQIWSNISLNQAGFKRARGIICVKHLIMNTLIILSKSLSLNWNCWCTHFLASVHCLKKNVVVSFFTSENNVLTFLTVCHITTYFI